MNGFRLAVTLAALTAICMPAVRGQEASGYKDRIDAFAKMDPTKRTVPVIPPVGRRIRVIFDTDANNEIDDIWAISLAILCPERFQIEGFVAANFDNSRGGPDSIDSSVEKLRTILSKADMSGRWPIKRGSQPMQYQYEPSRSEGVDFIIERAMASTPDDPLWVVGLGASTDIASAVLIEPRIIDRVVVFWHFRTKWPRHCHNFNVFNDTRAARIVFHSPCSFVLFDTGTYLTCPMAESQRYLELGQLGRYLHEYRHRSRYYSNPKKGFFDLGDVAALVNPELGSWEVVDCPDVEENLDYSFKETKGKILRCKEIGRDGTFELLYEKLKAHHTKGGGK